MKKIQNVSFSQIPMNYLLGTANQPLKEAGIRNEFGDLDSSEILIPHSMEIYYVDNQTTVRLNKEWNSEL